MEYRKIQSIQNDIYVAIDAKNIETNFYSDDVEMILHYSKVQSSKDNKVLYDIKLKMSLDFIEDTYHLDKKHVITSEEKIKASLDVGERAYKERGEMLNNVESISCIKSNSPLRYYRRVDMKSIE